MQGPYYVTTDVRRRAAWGDACQAEATKGSVVIDGRTFKLHIKAVEPFEVWEIIRAAHNYRLTGTDTGFYNCRHMRHDPDAPMSYHAWGMALDVNWLENPAGNKLVTDIPGDMIDDLLAVRTNSGVRVFRWGGDWDWDGVSSDHTYIDAMHWEVVAHPLDLATGIDMATVKGDNAMAFNSHQEHQLKMLVGALDAVDSDGSFPRYIVPDIRKGIITVDELDEALAEAQPGESVDDFARRLAAKAHNRLDAIKDAI